MRKPGRPKPEKIEPTPETLAKLSSEWSIVALYKQGKLNQDHENAAREIDGVWRAIMRGLFRTQRLGGAGRCGNDPTDAMTQAEAFQHAAHYIPWAHRESQILIARWPRLTRFDLALKVCTADTDPYVIARAHPGLVDVIDHLQRSLDAYARLMRVKTLDGTEAA